MPSPKRRPTSVADSLVAAFGPRAFVAALELEPTILDLSVRGVGEIPLPLSENFARALVRVAKPARFGLKNETVLDRRVRDASRIPPEAIEVGTQWEAALAQAVRELGSRLGMSDVRAELHDAIVYGPGQFFAEHQDSEKGDGMVGTLAVVLPSVHHGGQLVVEHHGEQREFGGSASRLELVAFYADCRHQAKPVRKGHRVVLTYELYAKADVLPAKTELEVVERALVDFFRRPAAPSWPRGPAGPVPKRLVYLLDHEYTARGLSWSLLKGADGPRAEMLRSIAARSGYEIGLSLADVHEIWSCEDDYDRGRRWSWREDDATDGDDLELIELVDSDVVLRHFVAPNGKKSKFTSSVARGELCFTKPSRELEPFRSEYQGYTGNEGSSVERWYHRAAVVVWPKAKSFAIRAEAAPAVALREIARLVEKRRLDEAYARTEELLPAWGSVARRDDASVAPTALALALELPRRDLQQALLAPFSLHDVPPEGAPALAALIERDGFARFQRDFGSLADGPKDERGPQTKAQRQWRRRVGELLRRLTPKGAPSAKVRPFAMRIIADTLAWLNEERVFLETAPRVLGSLAEESETVALSLLDGAFFLNAGHELLAPIEANWGPRAQTALLIRAAKSKPVLVRRLDPIRRKAMTSLRAELAKPKRASDDWSIARRSPCRCALCKKLDTFLRSRTLRTMKWPLAKESRAHVHRALDGYAVTHETERVGSPYTLVLTKTKQLFADEARERREMTAMLEWLATLGK
jgi:hypothetical protein